MQAIDRLASHFGASASSSLAFARPWAGQRPTSGPALVRSLGVALAGLESCPRSPACHRRAQRLATRAAADGPRSIGVSTSTASSSAAKGSGNGTPGADSATASHTPSPPSQQQSPAPADSQQQQQQQQEDDSIVALLSREGEDSPEPTAAKASPLIALGSLLGVAFLLGGGYLLKDQIKAFLDFFITAVEQWGPWGVGAYAAVYIGLEVLALPAIPLTMTAGVIFGTTQGTIITSISGTVAATIAFLIARYLVRDKVRKFASKHPKWQAIDRAIGKNGLKFVTLLRLSPLLPLAASNYLYGCTSVDLGSYVLGTAIGMLPGTWAYVHAGALGRQVLMEGEGSLAVESWQVGLGLASTLLALAFVGRLAKTAIEEVEHQPEAAAAADGKAEDKKQ